MDLNKKLDAFIDQALQEDIGDGDHTSLACIPKEKRDTARLLVKDPGVIAGVEVAKRIFEKVDPSSKFEIFMEDGSDVHVGDIVYQVECNTQALLKAERLSLNIMQRMSGIATYTHFLSNKISKYKAKLLRSFINNNNFLNIFIVLKFIFGNS